MFTGALRVKLNQSASISPPVHRSTDMVYSRHLEGQNPILLIAIRRDDQKLRLCRALSRIWNAPDFHIKCDTGAAIAHLIERALKKQKLSLDIMIIDLEDCSSDAKVMLDTVHSISGLRHTPVITLVDDATADMRDRIYDAGADLVVAWEHLESRIGDIAGLAIDNWLNTDPLEDDELLTG